MITFLFYNIDEIVITNIRISLCCFQKVDQSVVIMLNEANVTFNLKSIAFLFDK